MFCFSALSCTRLIASGRNEPTSLVAAPSVCAVNCRSGSPSSSTGTARFAVSASANAISIVLPAREMPLCRRFLSRNNVRPSPVSASRRLAIALFMSTCIRKCTPPRKSRPRYIGNAWIAVSQRGESATRLSATTYVESSALGFSAFCSASFARSCASLSDTRTRTDGDWPFSKNVPVVVMLACLRMSSTRFIIDTSTLTVARPLVTCTAGASPNRLGSV